ncbi:hypothetical protein MMC11_005841 [Xylographa trunciseda]|nr:hypothetical protein [Xylographa trunciseda]
MLSRRGQINVEALDLPWRFAPGTSNAYDKVLNVSGTISFSSAENIHAHKSLAEYTKKYPISENAFSYGYCTMGGARLRDVLAAHMNKYFLPFASVTAENILVVNGVTAVNSMLAFSLADPQEGVLVTPPIYGRFELDFGNEAGVRIIYSSSGVDSLDRAVVPLLEEAFENATGGGVKVRALLITNPSNPLGRCYPLETLKVLLRFCSKHSLHLISDEVYALTVFDSGEPTAVPFTSVLSIDLNGIIDPNMVHVMYGLSKDFGAAGLRLGCLITRSEQVQRACLSIGRFHNPSGMSVAIATQMLEDETFVTRHLNLCQQSLRAAYHHTTKALEPLGIRYVRGVNAGFFVYLDLSPYLPPKSCIGQGANSQKLREYALAKRLLDNGVFLHPGEEHCEEAGWFRLVYASVPTDTLTEGLKRSVLPTEIVYFESRAVVSILTTTLSGLTWDRPLSEQEVSVVGDANAD